MAQGFRIGRGEIDGIFSFFSKEQRDSLPCCSPSRSESDSGCLTIYSKRLYKYSSYGRGFSSVFLSARLHLLGSRFRGQSPAIHPRLVDEFGVRRSHQSSEFVDYIASSLGSRGCGSEREVSASSYFQDLFCYCLEFLFLLVCACLCSVSCGGMHDCLRIS